MKCVLAVLAVLIAARVLPAAEPVFSLSFDGGLDADAAGGEGGAIAEGEPQLVAGRAGKAVELGEANRRLAYSTAGNLSMATGSVSTWIKPVGFSPAEAPSGGRERYDFFRVVAKNGRDELRLSLVRSIPGGAPHNFIRLETAPVGRNGLGGDGRVSATARVLQHNTPHVLIAWEAGQFKHVAATWNFESGRMAVYLDGKRIAASKGRELRKRFGPTGDTFSIGPDKGIEVAGNTGPGDKRLVIDEVKVYDYRLSASEVAVLAGASKEAEQLLTVEADVLYEPGAVRVDVEAGPVRARTKGELTVKTVLRRAGREVASSRTALPGDAVRVSLEPKSWKAGDHEVEVSVLEGAEVAAGASKTFRVEPRPEWWGSRIGMADTVLPPYTPLEAEKTSFSVWGRGYELATSGLPKQMTTQGNRLLAGPATLRLGPRGDEFRGTELKQEMVRDTRVVYSLKGVLGPYEVTGRAEGLYDGVIEYDYVLTPGRPARRIPGLCIEIPLRRGVAELLVRKAPGQSTTRGVIFPIETSFVLPGTSGWHHGSCNNSLWVGNIVHEATYGLQWYTDTDEGWTVPHGGRAEVVVLEDRVVLRVNVLAEGAATPLRLRFGLLATPCRPLPKDWRRIRFTGMSTTNPWIKGNHFKWETGYAFLYGNSPLDRDAGGEYLVPQRDRRWLDDKIEHAHGHGAKFVLYSPGNGIRSMSPVHLTHQTEWDMAPRVIQDQGRFQQFTWVCPRSRHQDFFIWNLDRMLEAGKLDGVYFDQAAAYVCKNQLHGCGYEDGSARRPTGTMRAKRAFYRRVRQVFVDRGKEPFIAGHMSNDIVPASYTHLDLLYNGEQYTKGIVDNDYLTTMDEEIIRVQASSKLMGVPMVFMSEIMWGEMKKHRWTSDELWNRRLRSPEALRATRTLMAMLLPNDALWGGSLLHVDLGGRIWDIWDTLGGTRYVSHRAPGLATTPAAPLIQAGLYLKPNGEALLAVGNWTDRAIAVRVRIEPALFDLSGAKADDVLDKQSCDVAGQKVLLEVGAKDLRLVVLSK